MAQDVYRYRFQPCVDADDVESSLLLAIWGVESLHGETQTRLDAAHLFDAQKKSCVIDAGTEVGRTLNRLFLGYLQREYEEDAFTVTRVDVNIPRSSSSN